MSGAQPAHAEARTGGGTHARGGGRRGLPGEVAVAAAVFLLGVLLAAGTASMEVPSGAGRPGPQLFPSIVSGGLMLLAVLLAAGSLRRPRATLPTAAPVTDTPADAAGAGPIADAAGAGTLADAPVAGAPADAAADRAPFRWPPVLLIGAGLAAFILVLEPLGWLLSGAALFWLVARALGSARPVFDLAVAVLVSSGIQLSFSAGLGLTLPSGILSGVLSWIS